MFTLLSSFFHGALRPQKPYGLLGMGKSGIENESPGPPLFHTAPEFCFLSWCFTSTETIWLVRDGGKVG